MLRPGCKSAAVRHTKLSSYFICRGIRENVALLPAQRPKIARVVVPALNIVVEDVEGQKASLAIYAYLAQRFGRLNPTAAEEGLSLYDEYVELAKAEPGAHPRIEALMQVLEQELDVPMEAHAA